ncbi:MULTISPECIES: HEPN domain-containing protein [unclassified Undibacterium]|uniref:HEPN domain-containing protein n=1 Tax=unclassified Undibacterium TaxID=2630295 RepID=UPI00164B20F2|nr:MULTISPECIES: HEPN domain-containing protein [unclassified Undibacterium]MBC3928401.1 HEPN domain-containing protein [Undibacterium sp. CY21W]MBK1890837.1 HEPN domain-containing protein [Undibacterium sp. 14-3-2]
MSNDVSDVANDFVYTFKVEKVFSPFRQLTEEIQTSIEQNIVNVIYDSFVIPADEDYLMARLLAQKNLHRGFFWSASQALEKYLKAYLLMHDYGIKRLSNGHSLEPLFDAVITIDPEIKNISLAIHNEIKMDAQILAQVKVFTVAEYLRELSVFGAAANRYNASGVIFNTGHLFALDAFVYHLRERVGVPVIKNSFKGISKDLLDTFYDNNYHFAHNSVTHSIVPSSKFSIHHSLNSTWLGYLKKHREQYAPSIALQWLEEKMKI